MTAYYPTDLADLVQTLATSCPCRTNDQEVRFAVFGMLNRAISRGLVWGADWSNIWPHSAAEWDGLLAELDGSFRSLADHLAKDMRELMQVTELEPVCLKTELDLAKAIGTRAHPIKLALVAKLIDDLLTRFPGDDELGAAELIAVAKAAYIAGWQAHQDNEVT